MVTGRGGWLVADGRYGRTWPILRARFFLVLRRKNRENPSVGTLPATWTAASWQNGAILSLASIWGSTLFKGVVLQRKGDERFVLTSYASRAVPEEINTADELAQELKLLLKELGGGAKAAPSRSPIPRPPPHHRATRYADRSAAQRAALERSQCAQSGMQRFRARLRTRFFERQRQRPRTARRQMPTAPRTASDGCHRRQQRSRPEKISRRRNVAPGREANHRSDRQGKVAADILQLAPICSFNAFELAYPEIFAKDTFLLLDMGHLQSTVMIGSKKELVLVRSIDYGGKHLTQALTADGALDASAAQLLVREGDAGMADICRGSLTRLANEVRNSIGFFEGQREESIHRIFVSGGLARAETILQMLSDELGLPCEIWDPLETCEVALPAAKRQALPSEFVSLNVACGAAFEYLRN